MNNVLKKTKSYITRLLLFRADFFNLIAGFCFAGAFYELFFIGDYKLTFIAFSSAFMCSIFSNYRDVESISGLGIKIKKFDKLSSDAEDLLNNLKLQSSLMINEIISNIIQANIMWSEEPVWIRLRNLRGNLKVSANVVFTVKQMQEIKIHFIHDFVTTRFYKIKNSLNQKINSEFTEVERRNFPQPIQHIEQFNEFIRVRNLVLNLIPFMDIKISDCENIDIDKILHQIDHIKVEMKRFKIDFIPPKELLDALDELREILESEDILSNNNLDLITRAIKIMNER